jgi:hypothetical protein
MARLGLSSPASFETAYGETGVVGIILTRGWPGVLPYAEEEPA